NDDSIFVYAWNDGAAAFERKIALGKSRYPAGLAVSGKYLYVAENVADELAVIDLASGDIQRFRTGHYPYAVVLGADETVYVSNWGDDSVSILGPKPGRVRVGRHPSALLLNGDRLYVALAGSNRIAVVDTRTRKVVKILRDAPGRHPDPERSEGEGPARSARDDKLEGSTPNAMAIDGDTLYVAEADNNAVAVFDLQTSKLKGRVPTDWYPTALAVNKSELLVLTGKGHGSHANPDGPIPGQRLTRPLGYDLGQLSGTMRVVPLPIKDLASLSQRVATANNWKSRTPRKYPPFKHVVYIIKENRTYDQIFGDLKEGDGDPNLVFFDQSSTPNHRALALRFGLFDRFFTNAEVSSQGHIWSTAAYVTDFGEKVIPSAYSDRRPTPVDGEEIDEPENGFLWSLAKRGGVSFRDYGEQVNPGWPVTQPELRGNICPTYPPFDLQITDQVRADAWIAELRDRKMPALEVLHLGADHTAGGHPGFRTPRAYMADNDLALGRIIEALTHSPHWRDTVVFVLEDDSQAGPDHVDSHRSPMLVISPYNRPGTIHRFANTTDVVSAIEDILHLGHLSQFDYYSRPLSDVFASTPDLTPYTAAMPSQDRNEMNPPDTKAARLSEHFDFSAPDRINDQQFNAVLWLMLKGDTPIPAPVQRPVVHLLQLTK
ncbi:MAG TPA: alkaline phosphatase family protein, partial [Thermoanaerobaculia bacterium]|nr:alkaline phosphatase family protein [Thermoanaerobaculia bacterium]